MSTGMVNLDTTQYVRVNSGLNALMLQAHRDSVRVVMNDTQPAIGNSSFHLLGGDDPILNLPFTDTNVWVLATSNTSSLTVTETNSASFSHDFLTEVAKGNVPGHRIEGFQMQGSIDTTRGDIWGGDDDMTYPAFGVAETWEIASDSVNDTDGGSGLREVIVISLDANKLLQFNPVTMDGTNAVTVPGTHTRPHLIVGDDDGAGTSGWNEGKITLRVAGNGAVRNVMRPTISISHDGHMTVPADETAQLIQTFILSPKNADITGGTQIRNGSKPNPVWISSTELFAYQSDVIFNIQAKFPIASETDLRIRANTSTGVFETTWIYEFLYIKNTV